MRFRWSISACLLVVAAIGACSMVLRHYEDRRRQQLQLYEQIVETGGIVMDYKWSVDEHGHQIGDRPSGDPPSRSNYCFNDFGDQVLSITLFGNGFESVELARLTVFPKLEELNLRSSTITDRELWQLSNLKSIRKLDLRYTSITGSGLRPLGDLVNLRDLRLSGTQVDDSGLIHLARLNELECLSLARTPVRGSGLVALQGLKCLKVLDLSGCQIEERSVANIVRMSQLDELLLYDVGLTEGSRTTIERSLSRCDIQW